VTSRPAFGDFADAVRAQLHPAGRLPQPPAEGLRETARAGQVQEVTRSMAGVLTVMARYSADIAAVLAGPYPKASVPGTWSYASIQAQEALENASAFLRTAPSGIGRPGRRRAADPLARRLDAVTGTLAAGRDLLHTHTAVQPDGSRRERSEWAPVITSAPVARALLLELGLWARRTAEHGAQITLPGPAARHGTGEERHRLNTACQWLWVLDCAVQDAQRHHPVTTAEIRLLHAIPASTPAPRCLPSGAETITSLCQGTISTAERIRHAATFTAPDPTWSPALTADSLRHAATCSTVISHNCQILLTTLAARAGQDGADVLAGSLLGCANTAGQARAAWLHATRAWRRITTDTRGTITSASAETADLALWTGRLAYADPGWTPALGPSHATRTPQALVPEPGDLPIVLSAVHQASQTLTQIAAADSGQIRAAAQAGRLLVPTRSLPDRFDIPHPFTPAPRDRINDLLDTYHHAATASARTATKLAAIATDIRAPSHILTLARTATRSDSEFWASSEREPAQPEPEPRHAQDLPGPVERILHDLGVTSPDILARASAIDQLGEQLILDAADATELGKAGLEGVGLSRSTGSAELINYMLASGRPEAATILRPPSPTAPRLAGQDDERTAASHRYISHPNACQLPEAEAEPGHEAEP
jgi:hypothetical protein